MYCNLLHGLLSTFRTRASQLSQSGWQSCIVMSCNMLTVILAIATYCNYNSALQGIYIIDWKSRTPGLLRGVISICLPSSTQTLKSIFWQAQNPEPKIWLDFILPNHPTWPLTDVHDWNLVSAVEDQPYPLVMSPSPYLTFHFSNSMSPASQWDLHYSIYTTKV